MTNRTPAHARRTELVENFIHRLRERIEEARQQLSYLNSTLSQLRFGGERYEFITQPAANLRLMYDMVMDSQNALGASLSDADFRQKHQQDWDLLLEWLTSNKHNTQHAPCNNLPHERPLSRPLMQHDTRNLRRLLLNPVLKDIHPLIEHILHRGLKLEQ